MHEQVAVITGAAQGIGREIAERFLAAGVTVVGLDLRVPDEAPFEVIPVDITDRAAVEAAFSTLAERHGEPSICINTAGIYPRSTLADFEVDTYRLIFDVNVLGTWLVAAAFAARARPGSVILNVASVDALNPEPKSLLYSASKAAVVNLTEGMANELAPKGIRVNAVAPGPIATERLLSLVGEAGPEYAKPVDLAEAVWRLCADGGVPLVSGETIVVQAKPGLDD